MKNFSVVLSDVPELRKVQHEILERESKRLNFSNVNIIERKVIKDYKKAGYSFTSFISPSFVGIQITWFNNTKPYNTLVSFDEAVEILKAEKYYKVGDWVVRRGIEEGCVVRWGKGSPSYVSGIIHFIVPVD